MWKLYFTKWKVGTLFVIFDLYNLAQFIVDVSLNVLNNVVLYIPLRLSFTYPFPQWAFIYMMDLCYFTIYMMLIIWYCIDGCIIWCVLNHSLWYHPFVVPEVTKSTWQSLVMESELPVLVGYWATWCGPCKMIDPVVGKLSKEYEGKLKCYKLNTDENPDIASQYGVRSIPTMMIFKNGEKKDAVIGAVPESTLIASIEKFVER